MIDENYISKIIKKKFEKAKIYNCKEIKISNQFYKLGEKLYIKAKFFVKEMYLRNDTQWGENLYKELFGKLPDTQDIVDFIDLRDSICIDIDSPLDIIIIDKSSKAGKIKTFKVRIFSKKISESTVKNLGSDSEIFIEDNKVEIFDGEILVANAILENKDGKTVLIITEVL